MHISATIFREPLSPASSPTMHINAYIGFNQSDGYKVICFFHVNFSSCSQVGTPLYVDHLNVFFCELLCSLG